MHDSLPPYPSRSDRQKIAILGATGSIGDSALAVLQDHGNRFEVYALSGFSRLPKLLKLCQQFHPKRVAVPASEVDRFAQDLAKAGLGEIEVLGGESGLVALAQDSQVDMLIAAIVGSAGLLSTLAAAQAGKRILLANKESLVMAGNLLMQAVQDSGAVLLPLDSEHNAIFQCLPQRVQADRHAIFDQNLGISSLWLTASGGPFLHKSFDQMRHASVDQAIQHPNWSMGQKISVDSATMMNKGLELIEACHLFALPESRIQVVIHPQSIVHSLVQYVDGSFLAQLGNPDMKTPIAYALAYPDRMAAGVQALDLFALAELQFIQPDLKKFACLSLARHAMQAGSVACIALNAVNEVAVHAFLQQKICLTEIAQINESVLSAICGQNIPEPADLADILAIDRKTRYHAQDLIQKWC